MLVWSLGAKQKIKKRKKKRLQRNVCLYIGKGPNGGVELQTPGEPLEVAPPLSTVPAGFSLGLLTLRRAVYFFWLSRMIVMMETNLYALRVCHVII